MNPENTHAAEIAKINLQLVQAAALQQATETENLTKLAICRAVFGNLWLEMRLG